MNRDTTSHEPPYQTRLTRHSFLRHCIGVAGLILIGPRGALRAVGSLERSSPASGHPDPRPGITSEHVLTAAKLAELHASARATAAYEAATQWPQIFDGIACGCGCRDMHRSLLSCYETAQPTGCVECQEEGALAGKLAREGASLAGVRAAIDRSLMLPPSSRAIALLALVLFPVVVPTVAEGQAPLRGPNALVSREIAAPVVEPTVAVSPTNPRVLIGAAIVSSPISDRVTVFVSRDAGESWRAVALSGLPAEGSGDPQVAFAADGSVVASALGLFPGERDSAGRRMSVQVFRSRDDGLHWVKAAVFGAGAFTDHPQMIVGPAPARNDVVVSALYWADATARTTHLGLFRSRDAARTFLPPIEVATDSLRRLFNLEPLLFSDGSVFVPYARFGFGPPSACPSFEVDAMVVDRRFTSHGRQLVVRRGISDPNGCGGGLPYAKVTFAIHHGPRGDRLFALMNEELEGRYRLTLSHSDDRGATWSTPAAIAPSTEEQFRPAIFVDRGGTVGVSWCQADAAGPPRDFAQYFAASLDDGDTFGPPVRVSSAPSPIRAHGNDVVLHSINTPTFDSATASIAFTMFMASGATDAGEYTGLTGDGRGVFHPFWVDSRNGINQLWSASVYTRGAPAARLNPPARVATGRVELVFDPGRWDSADSVMIVPLRLRNRSTTPLCAPLAIEIVDTTTVPHPTILNASNRLEWAGARIDYTQALGDLTCLEPGHATDPIALRVRPLPAQVPVQRPSLTMRVRVVGSSAP